MKSFKQKIYLFIVGASLITTVLFTGACDTAGDGGGGFNLFSVEDDVELGADLDKQIREATTDENKLEYPILDHAQYPGVKTYVQNIVNDIIKAPEVQYEKLFAYDRVEIIHDDKTVNAFCAPGGYIYVYTGLLRFVENDATLAAVLAHEIAHAERRYSTQRLTKQYGLSFMFGLLLSDNTAKIAEVLASVALLKNSQKDEFEADEYSYKYLKSIYNDHPKYYPGGIKYFFNKIEDVYGTQDGGILDDLLSTHPKDSERVAKVDALISSAGIAEPTQADLDAWKSDYNANLRSILPPEK
jgi:predicted Zn-dependent protease